jgi:hypothetical protein
MQVRDVAHDCRVKPIELLRRNAVQRLSVTGIVPLTKGTVMTKCGLCEVRVAGQY